VRGRTEVTAVLSIVNGKSVKRKGLVRQLKASGWVLVRHGGKHHWYRKPSTRVSQPIPGLNQRSANSLPTAG
jgi:predicted RNA binding protein YcfA (HicA-like mRNA interferase family)